MSDKLALRSFLDGLFAWFTLRRALAYTGMFFYCLVLFLAFDFAWSSLTRGEEKARAARIANPVYDHGFAADFDGYDVWGELRYRLVTNSLGFKDASVRNAPLAFINLFPVFFAATEADKDWYERLFILGDDHFSAEGNRMMFRELARHLL